MAQAFLQKTNWISKSFPFTAPIRHPRLIITCSNQAVATTNNQAAYWSTINTQIEAHLKQAIPIRPPLVVFEPMHHLAFSAPKNTASALCVAACEMIVGGHREEAMIAASALHLMHAATYVHEHLPLTDRRFPTGHKSTINHAFGPNIEMLTADGFIPFAFELLASSCDHCSDEDHASRILRVMGEITSVMGSEGMVAGQYEKFLQTQGKEEAAASHDAMKWIDEVIKKTEGRLHACGAACGAILGGGNEDDIEKLRRFGLYAGMIQGILHGGDSATGNKKVRQKVDELRGLALNQLNGFDKTKVETISTLLEAKSCNA